MTKRVVSRTSYVDPSKIGTSAPRHATVKIEDSTTVRYRRQLGPQVPSAPPPEEYTPDVGVAYATIKISPPRRQSSPKRPVPVDDVGATYPTIKSSPPKRQSSPKRPVPVDDFPRPTPQPLGFFEKAELWVKENQWIIAVLVTPLILWSLSQLREGTLVNASWTFTGQVQAYESVEERSWQPPPAGAVLISEQPHFYQWKTVVDEMRYTCTDVMKSRTVFSHTATECKEVFSHAEQDQQLYSHSDRIDYDDGSFDIEDVYIKVPGKDVYVTRCTDAPVYRNEHYFEPVCKTVPITHQEQEMRPYYTYTVMQWVNKRQINVNSHENVDPLTLLSESERYAKTDWVYTLYFENPVKKVEVDKDKYFEYKEKIGQVVTIP